MTIVLLLARVVASADPPPSLVFVLLDTTRADRLGAWGGPNPTSPALDALAAEGVRFARHYANSHATRPSMPQLMSGRYYHQNILRSFRPDDNPREFPFSRPDPTAILLPALLRDRGFQLLAVSTHTWVTRDSDFGTPFERFELVQAPASRGHAGSAQAIDAALRSWEARDRERPTFLYVHLMDAHMPRFLPETGLRFAAPGADARRFRPDGEPAFDREVRRWRRDDADDFTALDRQYFAAVYDTLLANMDQQLGRLLARLRADDPGLVHTLVVVVADHGEELGEDGRVDHEDSLAEGVQHIPWIVAGGGVRPGQVASRLTENVDVVPTVLALLGVDLPSGVHVDGVAQIAADGRVCEPCGKEAAYYAWETYRAMRAGRSLLREEQPEGSLRARCEGSPQLYRLTPLARRRVESPAPAKVSRLVRHLHARLAPLEQRFLAARWEHPRQSFLLRAEDWSIGDAGRLVCTVVGPDTSRPALRAPGWLWTGRGVTVTTTADPLAALPVRLGVPDGAYRVEAAGVSLAPMPWLFGFARWLDDGFLPDEPKAFEPLGTLQAVGGRLEVSLPAEVALGKHLFAMRLTPPDVGTGGAVTGGPAGDDEQRRRLRALGYIQ